MKAWRLVGSVALTLSRGACATETSVLTIDNGNNEGFNLYVNGTEVGRVPGCSRGTEIEVDIADPCADVQAEAPWASNCVWSCLNLTEGRDWELCCSSELFTCFRCG
jgi:hypothetical protein